EGIGDLSGIWRGHWFTSAPAAFFGLDQNGTVVDLNAAACDLFGLTRETALGRSWGDCCVAADDLPGALDYLTGLAPDTTDTDHPLRHITLSLKGPDNQTRTGIVSGWRVHTQDGAEQGITVMALPLPPSQITSAVSPEDALALADLRQAETARAALGVGVWHYDRDSEAIIEDEGMRRLIGRAEAGGPTLISDTDQALADTAFGQLMSGELDEIDLELEVNHSERGLRKIALKGQAQGGEEDRHLFGIAIDITDHVPPQDLSPQPSSETAPSGTANENQRYTEGMEYLSLKTRLGALEHEVHTLKLAKADLEAREKRLDQALNETSRYEAAGRLSGQMAHDFSEMLKVMNAALEMIGKQSPNSDLKRLSDAALAAGRRGERLTRQLQGLIPPADPTV
ncbi:MAG: PAS domain S-box protein, partial [Asticcacaulis sp.]